METHVRIAPHHLSGTPENDFSRLIGRDPEYEPQCAWPEDCMVQWGHGLIPAVPFFEAFPKGSFIRGEGEDIAAAERHAFEQYQRDIACDHVWGRQRPNGPVYLNGAAFCRKCGGFRGRMFPEIRPLGWWRKPLTRMEKWHLDSLTDEELTATMDRKYPADRDKRHRADRILQLRFKLFGAEGGGDASR